MCVVADGLAQFDVDEAQFVPATDVSQVWQTSRLCDKIDISRGPSCPEIAQISKVS